MTNSIKGVQIDLIDFVKIWQNSKCVKDVADHFGVKDTTRIAQLAGNLRKKGVALQKFKRGRQNIDYTALAAMVNTSSDSTKPE